MTTISLRLPDNLVERLEQEMSLSQQSRSDLIRAALEYFLRERDRQRLLAAFAAEAAALDRKELISLAVEFAEAEEQALPRAEVIISHQDYERLTGASESLVEFMRRSPLYGDEEIEFPRNSP